MSNVSANTNRQRLEIGFSKRIAGLLSVQHLILVYALIRLKLSFFIFLPLLIICLMSAVSMLTVFAWRQSKKAVCHVIEKSDTTWLIIQRDGQQFSGVLMGESYTSSQLIILLFKIPNKYCRRSIIIACDSVDKNSWRRLRSHLSFAKIE